MTWLLLILCLMAASLLAGVESALLTVSRVRARHAADEGDKAAKRLTVLLEHRNDLVQAAIAANHLLSLSAFVLLAVILDVWMGEWGIGLAVVLALPVFLMALELVPKSLFRRYPYRLLKQTLPVLSLLDALATPWRLLGRWFQALPTSQEPGSMAAGAGITALSDSIGHLNLLPESAALMMQRFAAFNGQNAGSMMEPLKNISALPADLPLTTAAQLARETTRRHHLVMDADGAIVGCLDAASLPAIYGNDRLVRQFTKPITKLRGADSATFCLQSMRKSGAALALVNDEAGQPVGLLSIDKLLAWITCK